MDALLALGKAARPGPWTVESSTSMGEMVPALVSPCPIDHDHETEACVLTHFAVVHLPDSRKAVRHPENIEALRTAEFIAAACNALPGLIAVAKAAQEFFRHEAPMKEAIEKGEWGSPALVHGREAEWALRATLEPFV